jgi:hypothetical protein
MKKRAKKISVRLPNKLHAMLTKALDDVEKIEKNGKFKINMNKWAYRGAAGVCEVCLAGSQLVGRLPRGKFEIDLFDTGAELITESTRKKLYALNGLRVGSVSCALDDIGIGSDVEGPHKLDREVRNYGENPGIWKAQMRLLAAELEEANL